MEAASYLFNSLIDLFILAVILSAVLSWLIGLEIVNTNNRIVYTIADFLNRLTEPFLSPIRRNLPYLGAIDISPIILILLLQFIRILFNKNYIDFKNFIFGFF